MKHGSGESEKYGNGDFRGRENAREVYLSPPLGVFRADSLKYEIALVVNFTIYARTLSSFLP